MAVVPPPPTIGEYCRPTDATQVSLGFVPANPVNFNIKYFLLSVFREKKFYENETCDPWEHLARFYETTSICQPEGITEDQVKLKLFRFLLVGSAKDWLLCNLN